MADKASDLLIDVLSVYSPTAREGRLASLIKRRMESDFGYEDVQTDEAGNVVAEVGRGGGGSRTVLLCGHMDTVPGNLPVTVKDGRVFGRGAVDAKSPLCAMIAAGSALQDARMRVVVACVTREEGDGLGIQSLIKGGRKFDFAVFGEPGGNGRITVGYRGRLGVTLTTRTEGGHAASPWAHESAVDASLSLLERLKKYEQEHLVADDHFRSLSLCLTMIRGGTYHNVLPSQARLTLDVRVPVGMNCAQVESEIRSIVSRQKPREDSTRFEVEFEEGTEPYEADQTSPLVRAFRRAIILTSKQRPVTVRKTGTGDMNTLASLRGTPCVTYGPGEAGLSHTRHESVELSDYLKSISVITEALRQLERLAG